MKMEAWVDKVSLSREVGGGRYLGHLCSYCEAADQNRLPGTLHADPHFCPRSSRPSAYSVRV